MAPLAKKFARIARIEIAQNQADALTKARPVPGA
jgi:hypothetical protein